MNPINIEIRQRIVNICREPHTVKQVAEKVDMSLGGVYNHIRLIVRDSGKEPWLKLEKIKIGAYWHVRVTTIRDGEYFPEVGYASLHLKIRSSKQKPQAVASESNFLNRMLGIYTGSQPVGGVVHGESL